MIYQCINCHHNFNKRDAICEDWRDPERKFICPKCQTRLKPGASPIFHKGSIGYVLLVIGLLIGVPLSMMLVEYLVHEKIFSYGYINLKLGAFTGLFIYFLLSWQKPPSVIKTTLSESKNTKNEPKHSE